MADTGVNILMYHSISDAPGPTNIAPGTFKRQMEVLAECGYQPVSLSAFADWHAGRGELPPRPVVITFDDGFADFADHAFPELKARGWTATVFLPTGKMGGHEDWEGADANPPRTLMSWKQVGELAGQGIDFGGHGVTHADLTRLAPDRLEREIRPPMEEIERRTGRAPVGFAPPYGRSNHLVRARIAACYGVSVGTRLARAGRRSDLFDVPRVEMHYFGDLPRWRAYLEGRANWYFESRRALRRVREIVTEGRWR